MSRSLLWATGTPSCWGPLGMPSSVPHNCPIHRVKAGTFTFPLSTVMAMGTIDALRAPSPLHLRPLLHMGLAAKQPQAELQAFEAESCQHTHTGQGW